MAGYSSSLTRIGHTISRPWICRQCLQASKQRRRCISTSYLEKIEAGKEEWAELAKEIRAGKRKSMLSILYERGLVHDIAGDSKAFERAMTQKRVGIYCGIDPTAPSLHVGHMLPMMALFWMHLHGYRTVSLIGGATSKIGDPTGRTTDRPEMTSTERKANLASMHYQLKKLWVNLESIGRKHGYKKDKHWWRALVNNSVWWNTVPFVDVLKYLGRGLRIGAMLGKDTVKNKMESGVGMSFAEFSYPLLQAWDWWHMYQSQKVQVQIGGSDQYGNIAAGVEAVKYMIKTHPDPDIRQEKLNDNDAPYGFTVPLLTTSSGAKFGKSAGNAIWLDSQMTSIFDLYGFFVGTADEDVRKYLKMFTFLPISEISSIYDKHVNDPSKRIAQHALAYEFVELIHGAQAAKHAQEQHRALFANRSAPTLSSLIASQEQVPAASSSDPETGLKYTEATSDAGSSAPQNPSHEHQHWRIKESADFVNASVNKYAPQTNASNQKPMHTVLPKSLVFEQSIAKVLWSAGLVSSRSEGHRLALNQGAYIGRNPGNNEAMRDAVEFVPAKLRDPYQTWDNVIRDNPETGSMEKPGEEGLLVLRTGKWKVRLCRIVSDDKFKELLAGGDVNAPPGWSELVSEKMAERAGSRNANEKLQKAEFENRQASRAQDHDETQNEVKQEDVAEQWDDGAWDEVVDLKIDRKSREQSRHDQHQAGFQVLKERSTLTGPSHGRGRDLPAVRQASGRLSQSSPYSSRMSKPAAYSGRQVQAKTRREEHAAWKEQNSPFAGVGNRLRQMSRQATERLHKDADKARKRAEKEDKIKRNRDKIMARKQKKIERFDRFPIQNDAGARQNQPPTSTPL